MTSQGQEAEDEWERLFRYLVEGPDETEQCPHLVAFGLMPTKKENQPVQTYVVQTPRSNTNPSDKYRVITFEDFIAATNGEKTIPLEARGEYDSNEEAAALRDQLNTETEGE